LSIRHAVFEIFDLKNAVTLKTGLWVKVIDRMHERDRQTDRQTDGRTPGHSKDRAYA